MEIEKILGGEHLAYYSQESEQKIYVLPEEVDVTQLLGDVGMLHTGEIKQSQMWRKTDSGINNQDQHAIIEAMDKRIKRLEFLLEKATRQNYKDVDLEVK